MPFSRKMWVLGSQRAMGLSLSWDGQALAFLGLMPSDTLLIRNALNLPGAASLHEAQTASSNPSQNVKI